LVVRRVAPARLITQLTSDWPRFILGQPFQPSTGVKVNGMPKNVNAAFQCSMWINVALIPQSQRPDPEDV
jgi:hypothetical protein